MCGHVGGCAVELQAVLLRQRGDKLLIGNGSSTADPVIEVHHRKEHAQLAAQLQQQTQQATESAPPETARPSRSPARSNACRPM
jgi:hypothetical protein